MSVNLDLARWDKKYLASQSELVYPKGEAELDGVVHCRKRGLALEVACGRGANALYMATRGYTVVAIDGSLVGLRCCARSADHFNLPVLSAVMDLENAVLPPHRFDFISVVRYLQRSLIDTLIGALKPNGLIFFKTFNRRFLLEKPDFNPHYVLQDGELLDLFGDLSVLNSNCEAPTGTSSFIIAQKPI